MKALLRTVTTSKDSSIPLSKQIKVIHTSTLTADNPLTWPQHFCSAKLPH